MKKNKLKNAFLVKLFFIFFVLFPLLADAQGDPQEMRRQACEKTFEIIIQCQLTATATESNCNEISGIISFPQTEQSFSQSKPAGATDAMINQTVTLVADMCRVACQSAKRGKLYKTAQEWIDDGGCTIEVTH